MTQIIEINEAGFSSQSENFNQIAVGIDFGTTNSLIAISAKQKLSIIKDCRGKELIASVIKFIDNDFIIGDKNLSTDSICSIKRLIGKNRDDVLNNPALFTIFKDFIDLTSISLRLNFAGISFTVPELASKIFSYLKQQAEKNLNIKVDKAVITVPAHFNDAARGEVMLAAKLAGFEVLRLIAEPTAAAFAYGLNKKKQGMYLVYDLGGGTFDVSILNMQEGVLQVIATDGDNILGGDDIDHLLAEYLGCSIVQAKLAKESLSYQDEIIEISLTRDRLEEIIRPLIKRTIEIVKDAIEQTGKQQIEGIILVGGATRIPLITKELNIAFADIKIFSDIDPDKAVAWGAALQAENLTANNNNSLLIDAVPLSLGLELYGGIAEKIILRNSPMPISVTKEFTTYADNQTAMQFHVVQGEREMTADCRSLARFELNNLPLMKAGAVRIEVTFSIDADGILSVAALEKSNHLSHNIEIMPSYGLNEQEVTEILEKAFKNAAFDHNNRLLQETIINTKSLIYHVEAAIKEMPPLLLTEEERTEIRQAIIKLQESIFTNDREFIANSSKKFEAMSEKLIAQRLNYTIEQLLEGKHIDKI